MFFKQFYLGCLAHASYMVASEGEAAVIDPQRDVDLYLDEAKKQKVVIRHVIETHLHADFVSGHVDLAKKSGAKIYFGARSDAVFDHVSVKDGDSIPVGDVTLRFLETPGHTPESISILLFERGAESPSKVMTGDALFIGDVGRPDLVGSKGFTPQAMAGMLYDSLHGKLLKLPDEVEVFPAHGAGSACGRNISSNLSSTIGEQKKWNYALKEMTREEFVAMMTTDLPPVPTYFSHDAELNRRGPEALDEHSKLQAIAPTDFQMKIEKGAQILDVRSAASFGTGHIPGSINIGLSGTFAPWCGAMMSMDLPIVIVADGAEEAEQAALRLARVGLEKVEGYLDGGISAWDRSALPLAQIPQISVDELKQRLDENSMELLDVRKPAEYASRHVTQARLLPLDQLVKQGEFSSKRPTAVLCESGYRSAIAASVLKKRDVDVYNVIGGMKAWNVAVHDGASS